MCPEVSCDAVVLNPGQPLHRVHGARSRSPRELVSRRNWYRRIEYGINLSSHDPEVPRYQIQRLLEEHHPHPDSGSVKKDLEDESSQKPIEGQSQLLRRSTISSVAHE
jgi:hypothetical protein